MSLPNYELADLKKFDTNLFTDAPKEEAGFILSMATFYNDMKDLFWVYQFLLENKPADPSEINAINGQYSGQVNFLLRYLIGIFWEFLELLKNSQGVFENEAIKYAEGRLTGNSKVFWQELKTLALRKKSTLSEREKLVPEALVFIRNAVSFHYYGTDNHILGFQSYVDGLKDKAAIYASFGDQLETTRFYFADAATQFRIKAILGGKKLSDKEVIDFFKKISPSVRFLIEAYIESQNSLKNGSREVRRVLSRKRGLKD